MELTDLYYLTCKKGTEIIYNNLVMGFHTGCARIAHNGSSESGEILIKIQENEYWISGVGIKKENKLIIIDNLLFRS